MRRTCRNSKALTTISAFFLSIILNTFIQAQDRELIIVSPHWEGIQHEFGLAFEAHYEKQTGRTVQVRWRDLGGTGQIEKALDASFRATPESAQVDVFFGGGIDPFQSQKKNRQLLAYKLPEEILKHIPHSVGGFEIVDPDFEYYGAALSSFGVLENRRVVEIMKLPEVKTWEDLCHPQLFTWVSSSDPRKSGSAHMVYEIILQAYGWEKGWQVIYQSSANVRSFEQASSGATKQVSLGEVAYAFAIDINGMTQQAFLGSDNIRFSIPDGVSVINPDGIAIMKGAPNLDVAQAFLRFAMGPEGQALWMTPTGQPGGPVKFGISRMGVWPELYEGDMSRLLVPVNPFKIDFNFQYQTKLGSSRWGVVNDLMGQTVIDVHSHLVKAWKAVNKLPPERRSPLVARLSEPFVTEAEAADLAKFWSKDKIRALKLGNQWMSRAVARFNEIEKEAQP